jgi:hypothetical protein
MTPEFRGSDHTILEVRDSRALPVHDYIFPRLPDSELQRVPDSRLLRYSYILKQIDNSNTRASFGHYFHVFHNKSAKHLKLNRTLSFTLFHKSVPFPYSRFVNLLYEFRQFDVSRVTRFYQVPQHEPHGEVGWLQRSVSMKTFELR